ncbi:hypothetical protein KOM00_08285 [Geomonas sp. Red69]|uniref:DUF5666 domain-containing protein n=1 Tax=Geomonas diazotrophica TaxID=2843197 RepID=A0ABX8JLC4_9BACT|nr:MULTISPECIES: hypothetical protein [Geomonas]MBU5636730.1 hypothetical protein [Geomonas diazotrophica]QWV98459.1 hypothetical protein KP005_03980 [Geomonas nitrogeniifigens]QXE87641.1 hypothetical protein KP003_04340 [Geomonas nitrogeniifigens]
MKSSFFRALLRTVPLLLVLGIAGCGDIEWFPPYVRQPTTPDSFSFQPKTNTEISAPVTSDAITVTGLTGASSPVSITGSAWSNSTFSIDGGAAASSGSVSNGQKVTVTHTSASTPGTSTVSTLTIGNVSANFVSSTKILGDFSTPVTVGSYLQADAEIRSVDNIAASHTISIKDSASGSAIFALTEPGVVNPDSTVIFGSVTQTQTFITKKIFVRNFTSVVNAGATTTLTIDGIDYPVKLTP